MRHLKLSPGLILAVLFALTLLSACGGSASAPAATPTSTAVSVAGEFVGVTNSADAIAISTNGQQLVAYACDGYPKQTHAPTYAVWFQGAVSHKSAHVTAATGSHLVVTLTAHMALGTVTLSSGHSFSFTAKIIPGTTGAGLYRSEETFAGVRYLAGWIIPTQETVTPTSSSSAFGSEALLRVVLQPASSGPNGPQVEIRHGGILNEQTGALLSLPDVTPQDFAARRMTVPNLGTFPMTLCQQAQC
jgi:hypothetical protein